MKSKDRNIFLMSLLLSFLILFSTACSKDVILQSLTDPGTKANNAEIKGNGEVTANSGITVIDCAGRTVSIPEKVERIACLYAFSGHVVTMLGRGADIVAVVAGLKRDLIMKELVPTVNQAMVPVTSGAINIEELLKSDPDVIFVQSSSISSVGEKEKLDKSKIPYFVIDYTSMKEQQYAIEVIGKAIGEEAKAKGYNDYYQYWIDFVKKRTAEIPESQKLKVFHSINEATRTDKKDTLSADWLSIAGVKNVSVNEDLKLVDNAYYASLEQIYLWNPDVIIANEVGVPDYILSDVKWKALRAVKTKMVYQMPNGISRWGHPGSLETPLGLLWTVKTIYPSFYKDVDLLSETKKYYKEFFNLDLSDKIANQILQGKGMRLPKGNSN